MEHILSFDVAKGNSMVCLMNNNLDIIIKPFKINHKKEELDDLVIKISKYENITVIMESTSIYHLPLENYFNNKFKTFVLNPLIVKQNSGTLRKTKTDKIDCIKLVKVYLFLDQDCYDKVDEYLLLNPLSRQYFSLDEGLVRLKNRFKQQIQVVFPEFEKIFGREHLYDDLALNFIHDNPHPKYFYQKRLDSLMNLLAKYNGTSKAYRFKNKAIEIKTIANNSICFVNHDSYEVQNLVQLTELIIYNKNEILKIKNQMIDTLKDTVLYKIFNSFYLLGPFNSALLLVELGDIRRFKSYSSLIAFCGLDSITKQSGSSINFHGPISKTGNKYARKVLFNVSAQIIKTASHCNKTHPILVFYRKKQSEHKHHYTCLCACSTKILRILFALSKNNETYIRK